MIWLSKVALFVFYAVVVAVLIFVCASLVIRIGTWLGWFGYHRGVGVADAPHRKLPKRTGSKKSDAA